MKEQKGISHILLTIIVVIFIIIVFFILRQIKLDRREVNTEDLITDMLLLQGKVKVIAQENTMKSEEHPLIGTKVDENLENEKIKEIIDEKIIASEEENFDSYYLIDKDQIKELKLENDLNEDYYIVNYKTNQIISIKGIKIEGKIIYRLSELLEYQAKKEDKTEENKEEQDNQNEENTSEVKEQQETEQEVTETEQ